VTIATTRERLDSASEVFPPEPMHENHSDLLKNVLTKEIYGVDFPRTFLGSMTSKSAGVHP
jgi:hypothetical protein